MLEPGATAPAFELMDLTGQPESLSAMLKKGPVLLAFFKISCPVCQFAAPFIERLAASETLRVVGISQDDAPSTRAFMQKFRATFPVLLDASRAGYPVSNAYGISMVPSLFLVEPEGRISTAFHGFSKRDFEALGKRMNVQPFNPGEKVPDFRPG